MSLLYRAIWTDDSENLQHVAGEHLVQWLRDAKRIEVDELPVELDGEMRYDRFDDSAVGTFELTRRSAEKGTVRAVRFRLHEVRPAVGQQWTTTLTVLEGAQPGGTIWVDVERLSNDPFETVVFGAPVLVRNLIRGGRAPRVGHVRLEDGPRAIQGAPLAGLIRHADRRLPIVVFSHDPTGAEVTMRRANRAFERLAGVAQVYVLPPHEVDAFKEVIGEELAVWGGSARLYLPARDTSGLRPDRHRYVPGYRMIHGDGAASDLFVRMLAATVPATPPPAEYDAVRRELVGTSRPDADLAELLEIADSDLAAKDAEIQRLRVALEQRDEEIFSLQDDAAHLEAELNRKSRALADAFNTQQPGVAVDDLPTEVTTITEALKLVSKLRGVVLHPEATRDVLKLESMVNAQAWAISIWRAFRALDGYAAKREGIAGGFWEWCQKTSEAWSWPATSKKLSMSESETVMNNARLRRARMLPISPDVGDGDFTEMFAHIKIAEGGGSMAPRIYFYDDTRGVTGKVHVGFVGPHEHMENTKT